MKGQYATDTPIRKMTVEQFNALVSEQPISDKERILKFMRSIPVVAYTSMPVYDRLTGKEVSSANNAHSDGVFTWYESDIYHFDRYNLKLNDAFIQYALNRPE